jgi:hypothetical protein
LNRKDLENPGLSAFCYLLLSGLVFVLGAAIESIPAEILFAIKRVKEFIWIMAGERHTLGPFARQRRVQQPVSPRGIDKVSPSLIQGARDSSTAGSRSIFRYRHELSPRGIS